MDLEGFLALYPYLGHHFPRCPRRRGLRCLESTLIRAPLLPMATHRGPPCACAFVWPISHSAVLLLCSASSRHFCPFHPHLSSEKQGHRANRWRRLHRVIPLALSCRFETWQDAPFGRSVYLPRHYPFRNCWVDDRIHRANQFTTYPTCRDRSCRPSTFLDRGCRDVVQHAVEPRSATPVGPPAVLCFTQPWNRVTRIGRKGRREGAGKGRHKRDIASFKSDADARWAHGRSCDERTRRALRGDSNDNIRRAFQCALYRYHSIIWRAGSEPVAFVFHTPATITRGH
jgi:hypothetical protein